MNAARLLVIIITLALFPAAGHAKWWIFGQSENEISTRYLYLNGVSYDELGDKVTIYRETLENGQVVLRGKAATSSSAVGSVQVSTTNKESWERARRTADGSFEFSFRPETGRKYVLFVKIIDTTGKTNDVDATRKEVTIADQNIAALIRQALDDLIAAYRAEEPARFMALISENFAADPSVLDRAIRKDFSLFDNIDLRYTLNNVTAANGKIYAGFTFSRGLTSTRTGKSLTDKGATEFIFSLGDKGPQVFSMKNPLIFGLSDASNVATGTVNTGTNDPIIVVTSRGDVITQPFPSAIETINNDGVVRTASDTVESGSFTLNCASGPLCQSFDFASGSVSDVGGDFMLEYNILFLKSGLQFKALGVAPISSFTEAPADGYTTFSPGFTTPLPVEGNEGMTYAFRLLNGKYALLRISSYTDFGMGTTRATFQYKYQTDGSRNF